MAVANDPLTIIHGDALSSLRTLDDESVQCCVTSPPYWGLRDYGTGTWAGGDSECKHTAIRKSPESDAKNKQGTNAGSSRDPIRSDCRLCGARRVDIQIGLEKTPEEYVARLVEVFRELKRVLRSDGTLWLNLGDSYASTPPGNKTTGLEKWATSGLHGARISAKYAETLDRSAGQKRNTVVGDLKPKDLVGIPWMVAFALRSDGWYLRSDIIWSKPNPMPESVTDRPTRAHEYIFLLSKGRSYYYDAEAIKEPATMSLADPDGNALTITGGNHSRHTLGEAIPAKERRSDKQRGHSRRHAGFNDRWDAMERTEPCSGLRNKRSVWEVATRPFREAHFATFPPDLVMPCVLAGAPVGSVVLDPFTGSGSTGKAAMLEGLRFVGIELSAEYCELARLRIEAMTRQGLLFA